MNRNLKKLLRGYDREIAYKKAPDELKQKLHLVPTTRALGHPVFWRYFGYAVTAIVCVSVAFPVGYMLAENGGFGNPQITCDPIAAAEAFLLTQYDQSLRTPVSTFFHGDAYQISLYFAIDDGENQCFYVLVTEEDASLHFANPAISLNETRTQPFGSFALDTDESVDFTLGLLLEDTLIEQWAVTFDTPTYLTHI